MPLNSWVKSTMAFWVVLFCNWIAALMLDTCTIGTMLSWAFTTSAWTSSPSPPYPSQCWGLRASRTWCDDFGCSRPLISWYYFCSFHTDHGQLRDYGDMQSFSSDKISKNFSIFRAEVNLGSIELQRAATQLEKCWNICLFYQRQS